MPTPIGHTLAGLAVFALTAEKKNGASSVFNKNNIGWATYCVLISSAPDLDFIYYGENGFTITDKYHHGLSHSLGFALATGVMAWLAAKMMGHKKSMKILFATFSMCWLHTIIDMFNLDTYEINGIGLPVLWPLTDKYFILPFIPPVNRSDPLSPEAIMAVAIEIALYGSFFIAALLWRRVQRR